jgi:hypothetical protein
MNHSKKMSGLQGLIFPHARVPVWSMKKLLSFFDHVTICRPWFLGEPDFAPLEDLADLVTVLQPPENLKPGKDVKGVLAEYQTWMKYNRDKSYIDFIKRSQGLEQPDESIWDIRGNLRQAERDQPSTMDRDTLRWHLVLHLAQEMEDQQLAAERALKDLNGGRALFEGIIEETADVAGLLEDLPQFQADFMLSRDQWKWIFEAWFGLFGGYLKGEECLVTFHEPVMNVISEWYEEFRGAGAGPSARSLRFSLPDRAEDARRDLARTKGGYFQDETLPQLKSQIMNFLQNPARNFAETGQWINETANLFPEESSPGCLHFTMRYFPDLSGAERPGREPWLKIFFNRVMILVEDPAFHE